jgi:hypothetical protein
MIDNEEKNAKYCHLSPPVGVSRQVVPTGPRSWGFEVH